MNCGEANRISMIDFLSRMGYQPKKISRMDYWYLSPLRDESTASFKVNRLKNCWYDHGLGKGGSLIDFVMIYNTCDVGHALQKIASSIGFEADCSSDIKVRTFNKMERPFASIETDQSLVILSVKQPVTDRWLYSYAKHRNITPAVLNKWCYEVEFSINDKRYKAIGFKNIAGGYELRNSWFKGSSSPKSISLIENNSSEIAVFEGFFDFLTYKSVCQNPDLTSPDLLVLNSLSFFETNLPLMGQHTQANLYLNQDAAGRKCTEVALKTSKSFQDKSELYKGYKDLNDWHVNFGKKQFIKLHR